MSVKNSVFVFGANYTPSNVIVKEFLTNLTSTIETIPKGSFESLIVLSTCNRFEVIGFGNIENLIRVFQKKIPSFKTIRSCFHQKSRKTVEKNADVGKMGPPVQNCPFSMIPKPEWSEFRCDSFSDIKK